MFSVQGFRVSGFREVRTLGLGARSVEGIGFLFGCRVQDSDVWIEVLWACALWSVPSGIDRLHKKRPQTTLNPTPYASDFARGLGPKEVALLAGRMALSIPFQAPGG